MSRNHWSTYIQRSKSYVHAVPPSNFQICCIDLWLNTAAHRDHSYSNIYPCIKRGIDRFSFFACFSLLPFPHTISPYPSHHRSRDGLWYLSWLYRPVPISSETSQAHVSECSRKPHRIVTEFISWLSSYKVGWATPKRIWTIEGLHFGIRKT